MRFFTPFQELADQFGGLLPNFFAMIVILSIGIAISLLSRTILIRLFRRMRFDDFAFKTGLAELMFKANIHVSPTRLIANLVYGMALLLALLLALSALNLPATSDMLANVVRFVPNLIVAAMVIGVGYLVSKFVGRSVLLTAVNAEVGAARLIAYAVQTLIMLFAIAVGLEQIGLAQATIIAAFSILFGGLVLSLSIAFGLGGRNLARGFLERHIGRQDDSYSDRHPFSHL